MIRPRGGAPRGDGSGREQGQDDGPSTVGARLRRAREERGLDLLTVHDRLGRPITQIESLERDDHAATPDEVLAVSTLRRYATLLGLDGDALATDFVTERRAAEADTMAVSSVPATTSVMAGVGAGPDHLRAFTETGEVPRVGARPGSAAGGAGGRGQGLSTGPPTGTFPVLPRSDLRKSRRSVARARRRMKAPAWLKALTWFAAVLVVAVAAGWVLLVAKPRVLVSAHILRVVPPGASSSASGGGSPAATTPATHPTSPVRPAGTSPSGASYTVATSKFDVVVATSGRCWVQVTSSSSAVPIVSGVQDGGKVLAYPARGTMTVEVGSTAVIVGVSVKGKSVYTDVPKAVPFTYTFAPA